MNEEIAAALVEALEWYVKNDEVNESDPENKFWVEGKRRAEAALRRFHDSNSVLTNRQRKTT